MNLDNLIHMANRIGQFYESYTDRAEAMEGIANHIAKFWEPRMRRALLAVLDGELAAALLPLVLEALTLNQTRLLPKAA